MYLSDQNVPKKCIYVIQISQIIYHCYQNSLARVLVSQNVMDNISVILKYLELGIYASGIDKVCM